MMLLKKRFLLEICAGLGPRKTHLTAFLDSDYPGGLFNIGVADACDFIGDCLLTLFMLAVDLEDDIDSCRSDIKILGFLAQNNCSFQGVDDICC